MKRIRLSFSPDRKWRYFQWRLVKTFKHVRYMTLVVHRQAGKTAFGVFLLASFVLLYNKRKNPRAVVVMKVAKQAFDYYFKRMDDVLNNLPESIYTVKVSATGTTTVTVKRPWYGDYATVIFGGSGNINSFRGGTNDFVIIDEAAFLPADTWFSVLKDTLKDTGGKALITSTQYGRSWFYKLQKAFEKMNDDGHYWVANFDMDVEDAQLQPRDEIERDKEMARYTDKWVELLRESYNDPDAVDLDESPFARAIIEKKSNVEKQVISNPYLYRNLNVAIDIGKPENNAAWVFAVPPDGVPHYVEYKDGLDQYQLIDHLHKNYPECHIRLIYPSDVMTPSVMDGAPPLNLIQKYLSKYPRISATHIEKRTPNRVAFLRRAVEIFGISKICPDNCGEGIEKLSGARMKKDRNTEYISFGDLIKNGNQHCVDAIGYSAVAIDNGLVATTQGFHTKGPGEGLWFTGDMVPSNSSKYLTNTRNKYVSTRNRLTIENKPGNMRRGR